MPDTEPVEILYEDNNMLVCVKRAGMCSECGQAASLPDTIVRQYSDSGRKINLFAVHRLDRQTGGVMVYAKSRESAAAFSRITAGGNLEKRYMAVICGATETKEGTMCDLLYHDVHKNKTYVVSRERRGVRRAELEYKIIADIKTGEQVFSLADIELITGRTHQIRAQFASRGFPLYGDPRYGGVKAGNMALWSYYIGFENPFDGKKYRFRKIPPCDDDGFGMFSDTVAAL